METPWGKGRRRAESGMARHEGRRRAASAQGEQRHAAASPHPASRRPAAAAARGAGGAARRAVGAERAEIAQEPAGSADDAADHGVAPVHPGDACLIVEIVGLDAGIPAQRRRIERAAGGGGGEDIAGRAIERDTGAGGAGELLARHPVNVFLLALGLIFALKACHLGLAFISSSLSLGLALLHHTTHDRAGSGNRHAGIGEDGEEWGTHGGGLRRARQRGAEAGLSLWFRLEGGGRGCCGC